MKIEHIQTFLEVSNCGNFNRAAENLNVTQSTVSARIKSIEDQFGRVLFSRNHAGVELTSAGQQLREYALNIHRLWQQAQQRILLPDNFNHGFGLGAQVSLWDRLVLKWVPWMRKNAGDVAIHVEADYSPSLMRQLSDGILDVGVMYNPRQIPGLVVEDLLVEKLILVATDKRKLNKQWVEDYVYIDWGNEFRARHAEAYPEMETPAVSVGLGPMGLAYVLENGGSGYFPERVVKTYIDKGMLHHVTESPSMERPAFVVYPKNFRNQHLLDVALTGLREIAEIDSS